MSNIKLNNHVHNRLKKRNLKRLVKGAFIKGTGVSIQYYNLLDIVKSDERFCRSVYSHLTKRLRVRGVMEQNMEHFTGRLSSNFVWADTEEGHEYWYRVDQFIHAHYGDFYIGAVI